MKWRSEEEDEDTGAYDLENDANYVWFKNKFIRPRSFYPFKPPLVEIKWSPSFRYGLVGPFDLYEVFLAIHLLVLPL